MYFLCSVTDGGSTDVLAGQCCFYADVSAGVNFGVSVAGVSAGENAGVLAGMKFWSSCWRKS